MTLLSVERIFSIIIAELREQNCRLIDIEGRIDTKTKRRKAKNTNRVSKIKIKWEYAYYRQPTTRRQ